jgi:hypothetical protein
MSTAALRSAAAAGKTKGKGKAARRNAAKNACHVLDYLENLDASKTLDDLETYMEREAIQTARVTRQSGAGRLKVTLQDGTVDVDVTIAGALRFKGRAATKGDRSNCMNVGDLIVLHGPQAAGKIPRELLDRVQTAFDRLRVSYPKGFFAVGTTESAAGEDLGFVWGTEDDEAAVTEALSKDKGKSGAGGGAAAGAEDDFDIGDI